mmetsp:Transcript_16903/g.46736  ORF Transcript_16903/g.46736 Transcript_16903/m.46736 type:complete len:319 (-) Transcript_16903:146-1102(-)|eukprot:CAMPEP_0198118306 /NCGR_PEP_ID=MMETSP1442-20131203/21111_1 /TAXON_ID= /ORGANISM="Craspedostauros australis, Strain CCMP3328" /LENGTH=318 /DNA_ID=CAMNT_0043776535 /DNA_START=214 /DNA_END=1170 /DNA_ORIENTATION=+
MKRPTDQAKFLLFALLRSTATTALAVTGEKGLLRMSSTGLELPNIQLRLARRTDVPSIQRCNLASLPENYNSQFYCSHLRQWPDLAIVAEHLGDGHADDKQAQRRPFGSFPGLGGARQAEPKIVAYVLGKVDTAPPPTLDINAFANDPLSDEACLWQDEKLGHVTSLAVLQDYRRQGLARALMDQLHHHMQQGGVESCGLHVRMSNTAAYQLYEKDGYEVSRIIPAYYQDGEDAYLMKKPLQPKRSLLQRRNLLSSSSDDEAEMQDDTSVASSASMDESVGRAWKGLDLQLPRQHAFPESFQGMSNGSEEPELLTGTM